MTQAEPSDPKIRIEVDEDGVVRDVQGDTESAFLGVTADAVGHDLFREVLPAANVPGFAGRFREAVRAGRLPDDLTFALGGDRGSVRLAVTWDAADDAKRMALTLQTLSTAPPSRQREAMLTVDLRARAEPVDPSVCETEPIHIPGTVQGSAALLALDPETRVIKVASENIADVLGEPPDGLIGRPIAEVAPDELCAQIAEAGASSAASTHPQRFELTLGQPPYPFSVALHQHDGRLIVEFEPAPVHPGDFGVPRHAAVRDAVRSLRGQATLGALAAEAARRIRDVTGYERLLVYRFDAEWNGEAVGEAIVPTWPQSLLGLRFPASDIPRQARELYGRSPSRYVIDRDVAPVPLAASPDENRPVDLSRALHRSLSPIHLEYQRNLGVNGSMSSAIMVEGRLWGLVIGHHRRPHYVAPETREAVSVLVDALAMRIADLVSETAAREQATHIAQQVSLLAQLAGADDIVEALTRGEVRLTELFGASGAAIVRRDEVVALGATPPAADIARLAAHLRGDPDIADAYVTDNLPGRVAEAEPYRAAASGLLAVAIDPAGDNLLLWFRPEVTMQVVWGGDPRKTVLADARSTAILPRRSFERWVEEKSGFSAPWAPWEVEGARTLARAVAGVTLRASRRFLELSAKQEQLVAALDQKDRLLADKDLLTREIDHRVKNSLQIVSAFVLLQSRQVADPDAQAAFSETYARVMSIARVHDSLYQSGDVSEVDLGQTIEALCRDLAGMSGRPHQIAMSAEPGLMVPYRKAVALCLIVTELVTNALKYAYPAGEPGPVAVSVARRDEGLVLHVRDQGPGLPPDWDTRQRKGLGMKLIGSMLQQIGAAMDVESASGACFTIRS